MSRTPSDPRNRLRTARRFFSLVPIVVFLLMLILLAPTVNGQPAAFVQMILRTLLVSIATALVCIAAYGFYRYLQDRSPGL